eukprot:15480644-Alexandrium_andersonii.AAC.1
MSVCPRGTGPSAMPNLLTTGPGGTLSSDIGDVVRAVRLLHRRAEGAFGTSGAGGLPTRSPQPRGRE